MLHDRYPYYLANEAHQPNAHLPVTDKYTGAVATRVAVAEPEAIERAIAAAHGCRGAMRTLPAHARQSILDHCVDRFESRFDEFAHALCVESGKPITDARGEVTRLIDTFRFAAAEAVRITGEVLEMEISARAEGYQGMWKRVPIGPCSFIAPFNFPLNLAAHKIAPAIAAGCPFVLKPASLTPVGALMIGEVLAETNLPPGAFSILPCSRSDAEPFTADERLKLLSFTGSPAVGRGLKARAGKKKVVLELGGNAACIVDEDADLDDVIPRLIVGAFYQSGQSCIGVQRILIHESRYAETRDRFVAATLALKTGNPLEPDTFIGPLISTEAASRLHAWIGAAVAGGARVLCGGQQNGAMLRATILEGVPTDAEIWANEAFGPVACLSRFENFDRALQEVNNSAFGLQAGVFTRDIYKIQRAWDTLEVGGVVIGDIPNWRVDHMPYGGIKDSGLGREGIRYAIEDMTEIRLLVIRTPPSERQLGPSSS